MLCVRFFCRIVTGQYIVARKTINFSQQFETFLLLKYQFNPVRFLQDEHRRILGSDFIHFFNHSVNKRTVFMSRQGWACLWRKWLHLYQCLFHEMRVSTFIHSFRNCIFIKIQADKFQILYGEYHILSAEWQRPKTRCSAVRVISLITLCVEQMANLTGTGAWRLACKYSFTNRCILSNFGHIRRF